MCLRSLKVWAGDPSFVELRRRCGVPASTLADATNLGRTQLPRLTTVRALVTACGAGRDLTHWELVWRMVRHGRREAEPPAARQAPIRPCQLPRAVRHFVGRHGALARLDEIGQGQRQDRDSPPVVSISGPAGAGKTALAVRWARQLTEFPDGQLYLDLRGSRDGPPTTVHDGLRAVLGAFGIHGPYLPSGYAARLGLYRSLTHSHQLLVLLDDAHSAEQVTALLPAGPACLAMVTSRHELSGLIAQEDAVPLRLGPLSSSEAEDLLGRLIGRDRTTKEPKATHDLVRLCGYLPLAVRIAAANLLETPAQPLAEYVDLVKAARRRGNGVPRPRSHGEG